MIVNSSLPLGTITISLWEAGRCFNSCETGQQPSAGSGCGAHSERSSPPVPAPLPQPGSGRWVGVTAAARGWPRGGIHGDVPSPRLLALGIPRCAAAAWFRRPRPADTPTDGLGGRDGPKSAAAAALRAPASLRRGSASFSGCMGGGGRNRLVSRRPYKTPLLSCTIAFGLASLAFCSVLEAVFGGVAWAVGWHVGALRRLCLTGRSQQMRSNPTRRKAVRQI